MIHHHHQTPIWSFIIHLIHHPASMRPWLMRPHDHSDIVHSHHWPSVVTRVGCCYLAPGCLLQTAGVWRWRLESDGDSSIAEDSCGYAVISVIAVVSSSRPQVHVQTPEWGFSIPIPIRPWVHDPSPSPYSSNFHPHLHIRYYISIPISIDGRVSTISAWWLMADASPLFSTLVHQCCSTLLVLLTWFILFLASGKHKPQTYGAIIETFESNQSYTIIIIPTRSSITSITTYE